MLRTVGTTLVLLLFALAATASVSPVADRVETALTGAEEVIIPANAPGFTPQAGELDEIVGDTLHIGTSFWDAQHNGGVGRQIGYYNAGDDSFVYFQWTKLYQEAQGGPRHVPYAIITDNGDGTFTVDMGSDIDGNAQRSGYNNLSFDGANGIEYPTMHTNPAGGTDFNSYAYIENPFIQGFYQGFAVPEVYDLPYIWPHAAYGATGITHMVSHEQRDGNTDPMGISYMRWEDVGSGQLSAATSDGDPVLMLDYAMNISADITANMTGDKVAMGVNVSRLETIGEDFGEPGPDDQFNNDLYVFMSEDGGLTWDLDNPIDITQHIGPDPDLLPDTTAANRDTLRPYTDCSLVFDDEDRLFTAWAAQEFDFYRASGFVMSQIYVHHQDDEGNDWYSRIYRQEFTGVTTEAWGRTTDRPSLTYDMDTGILWCVFRVVDGRNEAGTDTTDFGEGFYGNGDVFVTASPPGNYNGLLWAKPVNITNTKWNNPGPAPAGQCQSETDPNVALRSEGDYLHIQYLLDLDAGTGIGEQGENTVTDNPLVYHRVAKQEMIDIFEANAEWQHNYPMHVDSTGFWEDPAMYEWDQYEDLDLGGFFTVQDRNPLSVNEKGSLSPDEFELKQNYPNPFNPSTNIQFSIARPANVKLAVYDVLGREVATLVNRGMDAGSHNVMFFGDDLPSGVYFYTLQAGGLEKTQKMVLMK